MSKTIPFVAVVAAIVLVIASPTTGDALLIIAAEVGFVAFVFGFVVTFVGFVFFVFAIRIAVATPTYRNAATVRAFE